MNIQVRIKHATHAAELMHESPKQACNFPGYQISELPGPILSFLLAANIATAIRIDAAEKLITHHQYF